MPDYKIGSHVRVSEGGIEHTGTIIGYDNHSRLYRDCVLIEDDVQLDQDLKKYVWHVIPCDTLTIIPLGDDNA